MNIPNVGYPLGKGPERVLPIRGWCGFVHLLLTQEGPVLMDTGLFGEHRLVFKAMKGLGYAPSDLRILLLTHGHLDHSGNVAALRRASPDLRVLMHPADQDHLNGCHPYTGITRICGGMEAVGRSAFAWKAPGPFEAIGEGDLLPFAGGLEVLNLPGHTEGHCAFFHRNSQLLFSGDLFASYFFSAHTPPVFLNTRPSALKESVKRVTAMDLRGLIPNHYDWYDPELHLRRFRKRFPEGALD